MTLPKSYYKKENKTQSRARNDYSVPTYTYDGQIKQILHLDNVSLNVLNKLVKDCVPSEHFRTQHLYLTLTLECSNDPESTNFKLFSVS